MEAPESREGFLTKLLGDLSAFWLELRCDPSRCTKVVCMPLRLLAARRGERLRLEEALARLRCSHCRNAPMQAAITDSPIGVAPHDAVDGATWRVTLLP